MNTQPYWWDAAPPATLPRQDVLPTCDVAIVGAGYTGLSAAITLARAGRSVQVFDKQRPGEGASTRNGGITSGNLRPGPAELERRFGQQRADAIQLESKLAREDLWRFIAAERIDCDFSLVGQFRGAATPAAYDTQARAADRLARDPRHRRPRRPARPSSATTSAPPTTTAAACGWTSAACTRPSSHAGMLRIAQEAGARIHGETAVDGIRPEGDGYEVRTARGTVRAAQVIAGPNGYADASDKWLRRRLVPVRSRIIATAPLSPNLMGALMPRRMMCGDSRASHYYYRPSPDGTRILFGGRDGSVAGDPTWPTTMLHKALLGLFPELDGVPIERSWFGQVAMNRDYVPRIFTRHGVRYAAGYCGSGVVWARWAGQKAAWQALGDERGASPLSFRPPAAVPLYAGTPWFMPAVFAWMTLQDRQTARRRARLD